MIMLALVLAACLSGVAPCNCADQRVGLWGADADDISTNGTTTTSNGSVTSFPTPAPSGTYQPRWDAWYRWMQPLLATTPFLPQHGNHELEPQVRLLGQLGQPGCFYTVKPKACEWSGMQLFTTVSITARNGQCAPGLATVSSTPAARISGPRPGDAWSCLPKSGAGNLCVLESLVCTSHSQPHKSAAPCPTVSPQQPAQSRMPGY